MNISEAIQKNDIEKFQDLFNSKYSNAMSFEYMELLDLACKFHRIEIIKIILEHPDIDINEKFGTEDISILHKYCSIHNSDKNVQDKNIEVVKLLLEYPDIDVNLKSGEVEQDAYGKLHMLENTPLHVVRDIEILKLLLDHPDIDVNIKNEEDRTPLILYCYRNYINSLDITPLIKILLAKSDIDINIKDIYGNTALHYAVCRNIRNVSKSVESVKEILKKSGININSKNNSGDTVLILAVKYYNVDVVKILLEFPNIKIDSKRVKDDLLVIACDYKYQNPKLIEVLLQHPNLNVNGIGQKIPLFMQGDNIEIVKLLLAHPNIDVNKKDKNGNTLLLHFLKSYFDDRDNSKIKLLLEHPQIDVNVENSKNENPFLLAYKKGLHAYPNDVFKLLISNPKFSVNRNIGIIKFIVKDPFRGKNMFLLLQKLKQRNQENINKILNTIEE